MEAPEFMTPEDGWLQLTVPAPFGDGRRQIDIFRWETEDVSTYAIYIDEAEMGELNFTDKWYPIRGCLLTKREIDVLVPLIEHSTLKPADHSEPQSDDEVKLRAWLTEKDIYPGDLLLQSMEINSFYLDDTADDDREWEEKIVYALQHLDRFEAFLNQQDDE